MRNQTLEFLSVKDNDLGADGGKCIGLALASNTKLKVLKISDNNLMSEGAIPIIENAINIMSLDLSKNKLESDVGKSAS